MRKLLMSVLIIAVLIISGCEDIKEVKDVEVEVKSSSYCGDGICEDDETMCDCASDCGKCGGAIEGKACYGLKCVEGECKEVMELDCCGNDICENDEEECINDCPNCNDADSCTKDFIEDGECVNEKITPCCGDNKCEDGENSNSCYVDCLGDVDLSDYPEIFEDEKLYFVIGKKAPASDVAAALDVSTKLADYDKETVLDDEISSLDNKNAIIFGTPCDNSFAKELMPYYSDCLESIEADTGLIRMFKTGSNNYAILVAGNPVSMTREAASWLRNYNSHSLSGGEVIVN